jgi:RNA polymerase sigma factor (TIGR02999 family)
MPPSKRDVTQALLDAANGDRDAAEDLWSLTYPELRGIARSHLRMERVDHTLSPTALVHEAYVRLVDQTRVQLRDRTHFFSLVSGMCRRVLVDHARRRVAQKRGGEQIRITLDEGAVGGTSDVEDLLALDEALERLAGLNERLARVVEMRYFGGLSEEETAEALGLTPRTVRRDWVKARGFLYDSLREGGAGGPGEGGGRSAEIDGKGAGATPA